MQQVDSLQLGGNSPLFYLKAYWRLTKPNVVLLMLLTALVGMCLTGEYLKWQLVVASFVGIGAMSGSAAAFNHVLDRKIDHLMSRTAYRPLPQHELTPKQAVTFSLLIGAVGFAILYWLVNPLTAWLTLASLIGYALIYTVYLKRATPQNIVIGGIAGAMPPLLGWTSITGEVHAHAIIMVMIIYTWTPPHFWALAIARRDEYAKVNIPMLPVTHGVAYTKNLIVLYTILMSLVCLLPVLVGMSGEIYLIGSLLLNGGFLYKAFELWLDNDNKGAMPTFFYSIYQLLGLFVVLLLDHYLV